MDEGKACPFCGKGIQSDAVWCAYCGRIVSGPGPGLLHVSAAQSRSPIERRSPHVTNPKEWLAASIDQRRNTDKMIEPHWLFMPLVGTSIVMIGILMMLFGLFGKEQVIEIGLIVYSVRCRGHGRYPGPAELPHAGKAGRSCQEGTCPS